MEQNMKAAVATPDGLAIREVARPRPGDTQVLVRVKAAGLNRADLNAAKVTADAAGKPIGMEWAGEVTEVGSQVNGIRAGDLVMCSGTGGYAEYAVTDQGRVMPIPAGMSMEQAGVLQLALLTAHDALMTHGRLKSGEHVLVQGASSGVGIMSMLIAKSLGADRIIGTSTNEARRNRLQEFGATHAIDSRDTDWPDQVMRVTDGKGVDVTVDMIAGTTVKPGMQCAALCGRIVNVGRLGGSVGEFNFDLHALRRLDYIGVTFRTRTLPEIRDIVARARADLWEAIATGALNFPIDQRFALQDAIAAQARMKANEHFGKLVLIP